MISFQAAEIIRNLSAMNISSLAQFNRKHKYSKQ